MGAGQHDFLEIFIVLRDNKSQKGLKSDTQTGVKTERLSDSKSGSGAEKQHPIF